MRQRTLAVLALLTLVALPSAGQEPQRLVPATVVQVAGSTVYVDAGSASGLAEGMQVEIASAESRVVMGWLVVLGVTEDRAGLTFQGAAFPLTRGQRILLVLSEPAPAPEAPGAGEEADSARRAVEAVRSPRVRTPSTGGLRLAGSVGLEMEALRSTSTWAEQVDGTVSEQLVRPALRLRATVWGLPAGLSATTDFRVWHRASAVSTYNPGTSVRVYQASLAREHGLLRFRAGRFWARELPFAAYWDGAMARVGGDVGAGVALGFTPTAGVEGVNGDAPKLAAFVDYDRQGAGTAPGAWGSVSFVQEKRPWEDVTVRSVGWTQRARWGAASLSHRIEYELDTADGLAHANVDLAVDLPAGARVTAGWLRDRFRPFPVDGELRPARVRERTSVGVSWSGVPGGFDVRAGLLGADEDGRSLDGTVWVSPLRPGMPTLSFASSYWTDADRSWLFVSPSLRKRFGRLDVRLAYHHYRIEDTITQRLNGGDVSVTIPLGSFWLRSGVQGQWGGELTTVRLNTGLWLRF